jgi:hypothetical protein
MALHISHELARLISDRAYATGDVRKAERRLSALRLQVELAEKSSIQAKSALAAIDSQLGQHKSIDTSHIRAISKQPRRLHLAHGAFTREIIRYMKTANRPVTSTELKDHLGSVFPALTQKTVEERKFLKQKLSRQIRKITEKGAIQRLHDPEKNSIGIWLWIGARPRRVVRPGGDALANSHASREISPH